MPSVGTLTGAGATKKRMVREMHHNKGCKFVTFKIDADNYAIAQEYARKAGMTVKDYVRWCLCKVVKDEMRREQKPQFVD